MSFVYMWSDLHLGHDNQIRWRTSFSSGEEVSNLIITNYKATVKKRDICWFLGDIILCNKDRWLEELKKLPGDKRLLLGNHDLKEKGHNNRPTISELSLVFSEIHGIVKYKKAWLSHAPIHPDELRGKISVHGHTHYHCIDDPRYVNVCVEQTGYKPVAYQEIIKRVTKE